MEVKKQILASQISVKRTLQNERAMERELSKFFKRLKGEVLSALKEYWSEYQLLQGQINLMVAPVHEAHKEYYEILEKYVKREYKLGQAEAQRNVERLTRKNRVAFKATTSMPIKGFINHNKYDLFETSPRAERDLLDRTFRASEQTMNRVDNQINNIITDGYRSGKGINDIGAQLSKRFDQLSSWESRRIARTEVNTSHNVATRDTYKDLGVEYTQWIAASDDRTRDSHVEVDGEIIPIDGKYSNGLGYPGDMSGPIEEWINCRCSNAPFVVPFGYMAPSFSPFRESDLIPIETQNPLETQIPTSPLPSPNTPYSPEVGRKLDEFGKQYEHSHREHLQYFTETSSSEVAHGLEGEVSMSGSQRRWAREKAQNGDEIHAIHNHPTHKSRPEGYTMFSQADFESFVKKNIREGGNYKTSSAENIYNRITMERMDNFFEVYNKGIRSEESLGVGTSRAIIRAGVQQQKFYDKYHPVVTPGMKYKREHNARLKKEGVKGPELSKRMEPFEAKAKQIDKEFFEERQREFPKLVEAMNKELNPYGINITSTYKTGVHAQPVKSAPKTNKPKSAPKTSKTKTNKPKISKAEMEQLDFLKEQYEMAKQDLKRLSKDDPMYKSIQKMAINNRKKIKELEKKMK